MNTGKPKPALIHEPMESTFSKSLRSIESFLSHYRFKGVAVVDNTQVSKAISIELEAMVSIKVKRKGMLQVTCDTKTTYEALHLFFKMSNACDQYWILKNTPERFLLARIPDSVSRLDGSLDLFSIRKS